ncbi:MAG: fluoride efflux transporter CrcB [Halofilum sp. (in: g-proteobacteria)]|nr:fluoride efflux transporter CrcB [Halofilum sp. (in: g-proteobacteria)]
MLDAVAIALGGAAGALARWGVANGVHAWLGRGFPWGTLAVNVAGSFAMGLLAVLLVERLALGPAWRAGLLIGFLGAFTTFSTFALETVELVAEGLGPRAAANMFVSVAACVFAALAGMQVARHLAG